jgi:hypothetical protein
MYPENWQIAVNNHDDPDHQCCPRPGDVTTDGDDWEIPAWAGPSD